MGKGPKKPAWVGHHGAAMPASLYPVIVTWQLQQTNDIFRWFYPGLAIIWSIN